MKSLMVLSALLLLFISIPSSQSALSTSKLADDLIRKTCQKTIDYNLCVSTLESNPKSYSADVKGLARIALELDLAMATSTLYYVGDLFKKTSDPLLHRYLGACIEDYRAAVERFLPQAIHALDTNNYGASKQRARGTANNVENCEKQFTITPFLRPSPVTIQNKDVHDFSLVAYGIISTFG